MIYNVMLFLVLMMWSFSMLSVVGWLGKGWLSEIFMCLKNLFLFLIMVVRLFLFFCWMKMYCGMLE